MEKCRVVSCNDLLNRLYDSMRNGENEDAVVNGGVVTLLRHVIVKFTQPLDYAFSGEGG